MQEVTIPESKGHEAQHQRSSYRGRVRSGCLTCRSRKVKCDEVRPVCNNCTRLKRVCAYKPSRNQQTSVGTVSSPASTNLSEFVDVVTREDQSQGTSPVSQSFATVLFDESHSEISEVPRSNDAVDISWEAILDPFLFPDTSIVDITTRLENALRHQNEMSVTKDDMEFSTASHSTLIGRDIELTTTIDILAAREGLLQPWFLFFVETVDCPAITPYDGVNWRRMKTHVAELGMSNTVIASAILAISALYKGQLYGLPLSKALSLYHSTKSSYEKLLEDFNHEIDIIFVATFLLCLFEFICYETAPSLKESSDTLIRRLQSWKETEKRHSELCLRVIAWLKLLHVTTMRGGSMGLISDDVYKLLPCSDAAIPNLKLPSNHPSDTSTHLYELLSTPIFEFYFQVQLISGEIAKLTHYHRSRTTGLDQEEAVQQMSHVKSRLYALWENRSATQRQTPEDLRTHLAHKIANPIINLIGICTAAYHAEFIEIDRVLGDPVSGSKNSKQAMQQIQEIIDGDWNAYDEGKLSSGYLRPLFLFAIECMDRAENKWAVQRIESIRNPICRSSFFASFAKELSDAQLQKGRRVTSKYFCVWYFGVPPPFM